MKTVIEAPPDFDFVECMNSHGWKSLLPFTWDAETAILTRIEDFGLDGVSLMSVSQSLAGIEIEASVDVAPAELIRRVRTMLQLDLPLSRFYEYCQGRPNLAHVPPLKQGRLLRSPTLFEDVLKVIGTTNTTWLQTKSMVAKIVDNFGSPLPGDPTRRAFPSPEQVASVSAVEFAEKARMGYRNASVHRIATEIAEGKLDLESWNDPTIPSPDLYKKLLTLPGIGPYAASCLLIYLGRYDRVNVDSWARMMVGQELGRKVTDKEVYEFFEPYGEWRALVYHFYKWKEAEPEY